MSASDVLRKDHEEIMKLEKVISKCYQNLYDGHHIPFTDIEKRLVRFAVTAMQ